MSEGMIPANFSWDGDEENLASEGDRPEVYFGYAQRQVIATVLALVSALGFFGNALVIAAVVLSRRLHRLTNLFVLNLSLTDLLTCIFLPVQCIAVLSEETSPLPETLCAFVGFLGVTCLACSVNSLLCIALNRFFLLIKDRITYRKIFTLRNTILMMVASWILPISVVAIPAFTGFITLGFDIKDSSCSWIASESNPNFSFIIFGTCVPVQFTLIVWSYARVFKFVLKHSKAVAHLDRVKKEGPVIISVAESSTHDGREQPRRYPLKLQFEVTKNLFLVVVVFMVCVTPFGFSLLLAASGVAGRALPFTATLLTVNSCLNPIIYAVKHPHFRIVFRCIFEGRFSEIPDRIKFP